MRDEEKTREQLLDELTVLRRRVAELELESNEVFYRALFDHSIDAVLLTTPAGGILAANPEACRIFQRSEEEICQVGRAGLVDAGDPRLAAALAERARTGKFRGELTLIRKDGTRFPGDISSAIYRDAADNARTCMVIRDVTERKQMEAEREVTLALLRLINSIRDRHELLQAVTRLLQEFTECEAVGIRLREGEDFPYFETVGFPPAFVMAESRLCSADANGALLRDGQGNPVLECMCGNVLSGRFNPARPFFTTQGSFWTNGTTALLRSTSESDRLARTRNRCNGEGYESVALIPVRTGGETFGLLQFNDRRPGRFTPEKIALLERIAEYLATALAQRLADQTLRKSEASYRSLFENMLEGFAHCRMLFDGERPVDFIYLAVNQVFEALTGLRDVVGKRVTEVIPGIKESHPELFDIYGRVALTGHPERFEIYLEQLEIWLLISVYSPRRREFIAVFDNISQRKQAEEALRNVSQTLEALIAVAPPAIIAVDLSGAITLWNQAAEQIFGWTRGEVLGRANPIIGPAQQDEFRLLRERIARGERISGWETRRQRKGGALIDVRLAAAPLRDAQGRNLGSMAVIEDITEHKRAEVALQESERRFRAILETIDLVSVMLDLEGNVTFCNDFLLELTGWERSEVLGANWFDRFIPEGSRDRMKTGYLNRIAIGDLPSHYENEILTRHGQRRLIVWNNTILHDPISGILGLAGLGRDVTDHRNLEAQLRQAQKMEALGTLAGGIAHDFNNILGAAIGYTELALWDVPRESQLCANLREVLNATHRAKDLVKQILAFSRQTEQQRSPLQIALIVKEALKLLRASLPATIEIRQEISSSGVVMGDPTQIHQVLMNLCTNASHAMRDRGGVLGVSLSDVELGADGESADADIKPGSFIELSVSDTGHGIEPAVATRMFDPFFTTKGPGEGTGMGLAVVHGIVKSHGGFIRLQSEPGKGAAFQVFFPKLQRVMTPAAESIMALPGGSERILFVDDEPALVTVGKRMLERLGYQVVCCTSGIEALEAFRRHRTEAPFDLVITDLTMPQMTGMQLAQGILSHQPGVPIIMCSGFSDRVTPEKAELMGVRAFVMKPLVMRQIAEVVRKVLDGCSTK